MDAAEKWWFVTQLPPSKVGSKGDLEILREIDDDELRQTREANALLNRLASAAPYARLVELFQEIEQALVRNASPRRTTADINRAARAIGKVAATLADDLRGRAHEDLGDGDELVALDQAIAEECGRAPFRLLVAVGKLDRGPFAALEDGVANDGEAITALAREVPEVTQAINLVTTLRTGVIVAQRLIGRQLEIYEERVDAAALFLRRLAAEVPDGAPALMRADRLDPSTGKIEIGQATFDPLALDKAVYLYRALRHAQALLAATREAGVADEAGEEHWDAAPVAVAPGSADEPQMGAPGEEVVADSEAEATAGEMDGATDSKDAAAEPPPGDRADQVVDLRALAAHATELTDELERAWSGALAPDALGAAQEEMNARFASLLYSLQRRVAAADRALRAVGVDPQIAAFPLPAAEIALLTFEPDVERRWRQLQLAEVEALTSLVVALEAMRAPSAHTVTLATGEVESWWEAGAFELVRARVRLLVRVSEAAGAAEATVMKKELEGAGAHDFFDRLRLAGSALGNGDLEAALIHGIVALRLRAALEVEAVPDDLLERLATDARLGDSAPLLALLGEAAAKLGAGEALDVGAAVLVAPRAIELIGHLCLEVPEILRDALGSGESDGS